MSLTSWHPLHALERLHQQMQASLNSLMESSCGSTFWMGNDGYSPGLIVQLKIRETETNIILDVCLMEQLTALEVQVSPETAVIRARSLADQVEGFFSPGQLQDIIPLPISVHPEAVQVELHDTRLTLTLPKAGRIDRQHVVFQLSPSQQLQATEKPMVNL